jgi:hypothetical protein
MPGMLMWCGRKLTSEKGIQVSLRTVERAVMPLRRELEAEARATLRFEARYEERDNAALWTRKHDRVAREVEFNPRLHAFARHWDFRPRACAPYRARTKGKDERGVGYVKAIITAMRR